MVDATSVIWDARFLSNSIFFSFAEIQFLLQFPDLSDEEKLLWLYLALHSAHDQDLLCALSFDEMATNLGKSQENIRRSLLKLMAMGFVCAAKEKTGNCRHFILDESLEKRAYILSLPNSGLLALKMAIHEEISSRHLFSREETAILCQHSARTAISLLNK